MGFNKGEIRVEATNINVVDRKRGESISWTGGHAERSTRHDKKI